MAQPVVLPLRPTLQRCPTCHGRQTNSNGSLCKTCWGRGEVQIESKRA